MPLLEKERENFVQGLACSDSAELVFPIQRERGKKSLWWDLPSGEVCLDSISVSTSAGPVGVIWKWDKSRRAGEEGEEGGEALASSLRCRQQKPLRANGRRYSHQVSACEVLALHESDTGRTGTHLVYTYTHRSQAKGKCQPVRKDFRLL